MSQQFLGEIRQFAFNFAPKSWALCNGQLLPINQNQALFALLGVNYGGNGTTTFALPDLRGRSPLHFNNNYSLGQKSGSVSTTLIASQLPAHTHAMFASSHGSDQTTPDGNLLSTPEGQPMYSETHDTTMNKVQPSGNNQPISNLQPYLTINFCIALAGIFPSHN